jgi:hypothetical protein
LYAKKEEPKRFSDFFLVELCHKIRHPDGRRFSIPGWSFEMANGLQELSTRSS